MAQVVCANCGNVFERPQWQLNRYEAKNRFCKKSCKAEWQIKYPEQCGPHAGPTVVVVCKNCGAAHVRPVWDVKRYDAKHRFCNRRCKGEWQRNHPSEIVNGRFPFAASADLLSVRAHNYLAIRARWKKSRIYTPGLLRTMLGWQGIECSFPGCSVILTSKRNMWNACDEHCRKITNTLETSRYRYRKYLQKFGLELREMNKIFI